MSKLLLWQDEIVKRVEAYSNDELLTEALSLQRGDDWDGCFTNRGAWECDYVESELRRRLSAWLLETK